MAVLLAAATTAYATPILPTGFAYENATPGGAFDTPTGIAFFPDGRMLVTLKEGTLWEVISGAATKILDIKNVVLNQGDRGLLDVAVDPNFATNRRIYLLYTVDPDSDGVDTNDDAYGRLVSYQMTSTTSTATVDLASRQVLFGRNWSEGPPSGSVTHTIGSLRWGADGSLIVSSGEGAHFEDNDIGGEDPGLFLPGRNNPLEDIGAFRAQYIQSLGGKILRINPATGQGYASNPFYNGDLTSIQSRVYAYGLRNPFRICVRPGTGNADPAQGKPGSIYIGDVGWSTWEEFSIATKAGINFGWPCREGLHTTNYQGISPGPSHNDCNSLGTATNPATVFTPPVSDWNHSNGSASSPAGVTGNAAAGSVFYTGTSYPAAYQNNYLFADYGQSWIRLAQMDANDNVIAFQNVGSSMDSPVDMVANPITKDIYYVSITTGQVRHIYYNGLPNNPPVAQIGAAPTTGTAPLTVNFSSAGTNDPDFDPITYSWDFGDGSGSFDPNPTHVYNASGIFAATLTVRDGHGGSDSKSVQITIGDPGIFPSTIVLDNFNRANGALGGSWVGDNSNMQIVSNQATTNCVCSGGVSPIWNASFGSDQEAYFTFSTQPNATEYYINMKCQGASTGTSHIEVKYNGAIHIATLDATGPGWTDLLPAITVTYNAGDQLGVRTYGPNINIYKNGALVGTRTFTGWQFASNGGYVGFTMNQAAASSNVDNFGGGNYIPVINTPPTAIIAAPLDNSFFVEGQALNLQGNASDSQTLAASMLYHWDVTLHHNNHIHPGMLVSDNRNDSFIPINHEDGTGTWYEIKLVVTDQGGLKDTTSVLAWPEVDMDPGPVTVTPDPAQRIARNTFQFKLRNYGRMLSRMSHWQLRAGATSLAEGDTLVGGLDSLQISLPVDVFLSPGTYPLRVVADTFNVIYETNENNNAKMRSLSVVTGPVAVDDVPGPLQLSSAIPNPTSGPTRLALMLPHAARVAMSVHDVQGREVWSTPARDLGAGHWDLVWDSERVRSGIYLLRVEAAGTTWVRRVAVVR